MATALAALMSMPIVPLAPEPTPVQPLTRLAAALGPGCPRLFVKRDDLLSFGLGGNKVRKVQAIAAEARAAGADTLITCGGLQSNHARVTAAAGAALGFRVILVLNAADGREPATPAGNLRLDRIFGADVRYVASREARQPAMEAAADELRAQGRRPFIIPLGGSTPTGALGFARGLAEVAASGPAPDVIVHASSSGGTQSGLIAGGALLGMRARVIGVSADDPAATLRAVIAGLLEKIAARLGAAPATLGLDKPIDVDDRFVGGGYGIPTAASTAAIELVARREGIVLDPVYTAKAMSGLLARIRAGEFSKDQTILFWHTGGDVMGQ
jgi:1-aminocyclopropane-1-carboxylate deaminase/D-cysteine desulfhydrase-like pyridoxal-dependent ACC family enzyme